MFSVITKSITAFIVAFSMNAFANEVQQDREVVVGVNDAYVPGGFDQTSDVFVIASGLFPNGCYRWKRSEVNHISATVHEVKAIASVSQGMCLMVLVPFTKEIHIGNIGAGDHTVRILNGDGTYMEKKIQIEQ